MARRKKAKSKDDVWVLPVRQIKRQLGRIPCAECLQPLSTTKSWAIELRQDVSVTGWCRQVRRQWRLPHRRMTVNSCSRLRL